MPHYVIHFGDSYPDSPGTGDPMTEGVYHDFSFTGTLEEAIEERNRLNFERFRGDLRSWITLNGTMVWPKG